MYVSLEHSWQSILSLIAEPDATGINTIEDVVQKICLTC